MALRNLFIVWHHNQQEIKTNFSVIRQYDFRRLEKKTQVTKTCQSSQNSNFMALHFVQ